MTEEDEYEKKINVILQELVYNTIKNEPKNIVRNNRNNKIIKIATIYEKMFKKNRQL